MRGYENLGKQTIFVYNNNASLKEKIKRTVYYHDFNKFHMARYEKMYRAVYFILSRNEYCLYL